VITRREYHNYHYCHHHRAQQQQQHVDSRAEDENFHTGRHPVSNLDINIHACITTTIKDSTHTTPLSGRPKRVKHPDDLHKILHGGQTMAKTHNGEEILPKAPTP